MICQVDKLYVAKSQINDGKHIDLDNPSKAKCSTRKPAQAKPKQAQIAFENIGLEGLAERELSLSALRLDEAYEFVSRHKSPALGLKNLLRQVELRQKTASAELRNGFFYDLEQQELVSVFKNKEHHADIGRELETFSEPSLKPGLTNNQQAIALAENIHKSPTRRHRSGEQGGFYFQHPGRRYHPPDPL